MLDFFRKHSQGVLVWLLVGAIAFIFIVQFGPQSRGCGKGKLKTEFVVKVWGYAVSPDAWRWCWIMHNGSSMEPKEAKAMRLRETVVDGLVERELLVHEAQKMGLRVSDEDVEDSLLANRLYMTSSVHAMGRSSRSGIIPMDFTRDDGSFDFETFKMFVTNRFHMSLASFKEQQMREMLAQHLRQLMEAAVRVSDAEVRAEYDASTNRAKVGYVTFDPAFFIRRLDPTDQEVKAWTEAHLEEVEKKYEDESYKYKNVEKQVHARHILVRVEGGASEEEEAAKKALAEEILAKARSGVDFAKLARETSEDEGSAKRGGDLGFKSRGQLVEEFEDVAFGMEPGEIAGPVKTMFGYHIIKCDGFREGDIPFEDVKEEIGRNLMALSLAREQARTAAEELLAKVEAGTGIEEAAASLEAVYYPPEASAPGEGDETGQEGAQEKPRDPLMPRYKLSGWVPRESDSVPGIGKSPELVEEIFGLDPDKGLIDHVVSVGDRWFVMEISEKMTPSDDDFATKRADIKRYLEGEKKISMFTQWIDDLRDRAEAQGKIEINQAYLRYGVDESKEGAAEEEKAD
jgi:peptidyl-prolyl cis-trans isomerase D